MKIISFRHRGNDLCDIVTEDGKVYSLYEDVIINYLILTKKETICNNQLKSLLFFYTKCYR